MHLGVGEAQVGENVAGAAFDFQCICLHGVVFLSGSWILPRGFLIRQFTRARGAEADEEGTYEGAGLGTHKGCPYGGDGGEGGGDGGGRAWAPTRGAPTGAFRGEGEGDGSGRARAPTRGAPTGVWGEGETMGEGGLGHPQGVPLRALGGEPD